MEQITSGSFAHAVRIDVQGKVFEQSVSLKELDPGHADERRQRRMLQTISTAGAAVAAAAHGIRTAFGTAPTLLTSLVVAAIVLSLLTSMFLLKGKLAVSRIASLPIGVMVVAVPCLASQNGGMHAPILAMAPTIPIVAGFFLGHRKALAVAATLTLEIAAVAVLGEMGLLPAAEIAPFARAAIFVTFMLINMVIVTVYELGRRAVETRLRDVAAELYQSSIVDPLTLLFNRRHFGDRMREEVAYAKRHQTRVGVLLVDADHFKAVNDGHGHDAGDYVLKSLATVLNDTLRAEDVLARYGGEEFVVLLRDVSSAQIHSAAERIRRAVESHRFEFGGATIPVTISIGGASLTGTEATAENLLLLADTRLYAAKRAGRNCVIADGVFSMFCTSQRPGPRVSKNPERRYSNPTAMAS